MRRYEPGMTILGARRAAQEEQSGILIPLYLSDTTILIAPCVWLIA
jgi:hypothetical protein